MSTIHQIPDAGEVERQASEWIARLKADDLTEEERLRFEAWRTAHPLHTRTHDEMSALWKELENTGPLVRAVSFAQSVNDATTGYVKTHQPVRRSKLLAWKFAAVLVVSILTGVLYLEPWTSKEVYTTAIGEHATISLPDGSTLELNSNSAASVDYSKEARVIRLKRGEGYFKVAHDTSRPFWVVGDKAWIRAVGTAFNVYLKSDAVRITVSQGIVKVGSAASLDGKEPSDRVLRGTTTAVLTAGEQADLHGAETETRKLSSTQLQRSEGWRNGTMYFENQPLSEVVDELSRYTPQRLVLQGDSIRNLPVGGTFETSPQGTQAFLTMLEQGFGLTVHREPDRVVIEAPPKKSPH
jgi:transmembrane sensor